MMCKRIVLNSYNVSWKFCSTTPYHIQWLTIEALMQKDFFIQIFQYLDNELDGYEKQLGIKYTDQKIKWDFWNAMLYAQTICTTIGYGHLYPSTKTGKIFTMLYAIIGIPLVLTILDDLGKLLTKCLKTPWYFFKCTYRRLFRFCSKRSLEEIKKLNEADKEDLEVFDLPIPVAIFVVIAWIFICSATFCIWEHNWDYFVAFYFFFISLSTIGLGDITPSEPKYLLTLFIYIIIGLSLVSMCINLIQAKMERTYETGRDQFAALNALSPDHSVNQLEFTKEFARIRRQSSSLGVLRSGSSHYLSRDAVQAFLLSKKKTNKTSQTVLSFPASSTNVQLTKSISNAKVRFLPRSLSIDDVMRLVDTEEGDILVLTDLLREESGWSESPDNSEHNGSQSSQIAASKSFDKNISPSGTTLTSMSSQTLPKKTGLEQQDSQPSAIRCPSIGELEALEEMEDKLLLRKAVQFSTNPMVHFRTRLSLIPEQQSLCDDKELRDVDKTGDVLCSLDSNSPNKNKTSLRRK
ncbi:unnamed protein product [Enterobius vermicularis]|uniref:Ion_trans_2 domain-containing protein n=1 Tax=Enterobius vermicularis TaxID=51028 RepID=A0A0N4V6T4_ENTVE|nr:unnamed protein product [Enterobius vermicularis]